VATTGKIKAAIATAGLIIARANSYHLRRKLISISLNLWASRNVTAKSYRLTVSFALGQTHVAGSLKYFHEFDVENRLEGDAGYVNFVIHFLAGLTRTVATTVSVRLI